MQAAGLSPSRAHRGPGRPGTGGALSTTEAVVRARSRQALGLTAALQAVVAAKKTHERALKELLRIRSGQHPDGGLFLALPGAGVVTAAALLGALSEDRTSLPTAADLQHPLGGYPRRDRAGDDPEGQQSPGGATPRLQRPSARGPHAVCAVALMNDN